MKRLIVNADDFGLTKGVTDGIVEAHQRGIVTSTSIMASSEMFAYAVDRANQNPALSVGVHLTLMEERPLSATGTLARGLPASYTQLLAGVLLHRIPLADVERELRAQVEKCLTSGLRPTHLDSHQHVHAMPSILRIVVKMAQDYRIPRVRIPNDFPRLDRSWQKSALCLVAASGARRLRAVNIRACDRMAGLFESGALDESALLGILEHLGDGVTELVCHPGWEDDACRQRYAHWRYHWETEMTALTSAAVRARIASLGIQLAAV